MTNKATEATTVVSTFSASYGIMLDNPMIITISVVSGLLGIWNAIAFLDKKKQLGRNIQTYDAIFKGAFIGTLSAPILTLLLIVFIDPILNKYIGISISEDKQIFLYLLYSLLGLFFGRKFGYYAINYKLHKPKENKDD